MKMHIVLFSGLSDSDLAIIFTVISTIHLVLSFVFAFVAILIAHLFTKRKIVYWPVFLCAFLLGELCLLKEQYGEHTEAADEAVPFQLVYITVMIIGFTCGIFWGLKQGQKKEAENPQS